MRGSRAGTRALERGRGDRHGVLLLLERARGGGSRGWRAGHGAARLLGVSSGSSLHRRQPPAESSQAAQRPGRLPGA